MKIHYTENAWHRAAIEDSNARSTIVEIEFQSGDTLVVCDEEYSQVECALNECEWYYSGHVYQGDPRSVLECVTIYKTVDSDIGA